MNIITPQTVVQASGPVNLKGSWDSFWNAVEGQAGPILTLASIFGCVIVVAAIVKWAWDRRRGGGGGNSGAVWGALLVGCILAAPGVLIPIVLGFLDVVANAVIEVFESAEKS